MPTCKKVLLNCIGVYLFAALSLAHAQDVPGPGGPSPQWRPGQHIREIFSQLNLSDDQKKQLEANKQQSRAKMQAARQEMKTSREALHAELMKPQLDMSKVNEFQSQIKALQSQMEDDKLNSILAVRAILTPEQFLKFVDLMHKHKQAHDE